MCTSSPLPLTHSAFVFLQLKLCWTAARAKHPSSSRFRESKATAFRLLGPAVTSAPLCKMNIIPPSIEGSRGGCKRNIPKKKEERKSSGNVFELLLLLTALLFCITSFVAKNGHQLCVSHPSEAKWVKKHIDALEKRKEKHAKSQVQTKQLYFCLSFEGKLH